MSFWDSFGSQEEAIRRPEHSIEEEENLDREDNVEENLTHAIDFDDSDLEEGKLMAIYICRFGCLGIWLGVAHAL